VKPYAKIIFWLGMLIIALAVIIFRLRVETDISLFLPRSSSPQEHLLIDQFRNGPVSKLLMISIQGTDSKTLARLSASLTQKLKNNSAFVSFLNSEKSTFIRMEKFLFKNRYLLSPAISPERFSPQSLHDILLKQLDRLALSRGYIEKRYLDRDPSGEFISLIEAFEQTPLLNKQHGVWFSLDGKHAYLVAEIMADGFNLNQLERAVHIIDDSFNELEKDSSVSLSMVGPAAFAVASRESIRRDITRLTIIATCLVMSIIYLFYRSLTLIFFCSIPLLCGVLISISTITLVFGSIHGITLAFGLIIIGVAIDYPLHLFSHIKVDEHSSTTMDRLWPTLRLGAITSSLGFVSMFLSGFDGLVQLATFAVCGILTAALVTRHILSISGISPLIYLPKRLEELPFESLTKNKKLFYIFLAGVIAFLFCQRGELWENDIAQLSPVPSSQLALDRQVRKELGLPNIDYWIVVKGKSEQSVLQETELVVDRLQTLKNNGSIGGFDAATKYLPSLKRQIQRIKSLPTTIQLESSLGVAIKGLPFRKNAFERFIKEVSTAKDLDFLTLDQLKGTLLEARVNKLFYYHENLWLSLLPLKGDVDKKLVTRSVSSLSSKNVFIFEPRKTSNSLINRYRDRGLLFFVGGLLIIALTLRIALRQWTTVGRVLIPTLGSVLTVVAVLTAINIPLSLFHLVSLLLVIGLGIDYTLFLNHRLILKEERSQTHHALIACNLSTLTVFGTLAFSTTPILRAIGITVAIGAFLCILFAFIFALKPKTKEDLA
jgi:predicted exporter